MAPVETRCCPIIYVRGYAMTEREIDETTADPFCGFNVGSTVFRAVSETDKPARKLIFESPLVRLMDDFHYTDVFDNGDDLLDAPSTKAIPPRSIVIYHYYEQASNLLGTGTTPSIEDFATGLGKLILRVRELVCNYGDDPAQRMDPSDFRCHLVAHSMGGLVCRAFLQNPALGSKEARACVSKLFTYATPHNGIEMAGINVPSFLGAFKMNTFSRDQMARYLALPAAAVKADGGGRVDWLPESSFPSRRVFCLIGTNRNDYETAKGLSRTFSGRGGDGLVLIKNASVWGLDDNGDVSAPCATAYVYRSHSGYFGIVNSEEGYQNLTRFLFGDVRIDIWVDIEKTTFPPEIEKYRSDDKKIEALHLFEILAAPRGKLWYLTRRVVEEDSVACAGFEEMRNATKDAPHRIYLSSVFLNSSFSLAPQGDNVAYGLIFRIRVPDYLVDNAFWLDTHVEGRNLFEGSLYFELPTAEAMRNATGDEPYVKYVWGDGQKGEKSCAPLRTNGAMMLPVPFASAGQPGVLGTLRFLVSSWT